MKIFISCFECVKNNHQDIYGYDYLEIHSNKIYTLTCNRGHTSEVYVQEEPFEILFDMGILALLDGYYREAVSNFAASLERFHEFCVKVMLDHNRTSHDEFSKTWKYFASSSERQLGAFYISYLNTFGKAPENINEFKIDGRTLSNFRNRVIHNGDFPKHQNVLEYARKIYDYMISILKEMEQEFDDAIRRVISTGDTRKGEMMSSNLTISSCISLNDIGFGVFGERTFDDTLKDFKERKDLIYKK
ncbi:hypothetical protein BW897_12745 [Bacillus cereus]|uniref:Uncharacterized protein n=1 Tax=Bacillus cereus TaxID=1396 RepID=A0A1S9TR94_BACCE|nr:hypothetical protein [Bacillus cereus]OOR12564.1 hypothetical protein BW897_12745 [Bacillus cereus]